MTNLEQKHPLVQRIVSELQQTLGADAFAIVDHWDDDPLSVGVAAPHDRKVLVHIVVDPADPEHVFGELELPPHGITDIPYTPTGAFEQLTLSDLTKVITNHLGIADSRTAP